MVRTGQLRVRHRADEAIQDLYPCFYGGGGSSAFDRRKFDELGGFDHLLRPFYLEDTDLGMMAWKRGWKVLYQPRSVVYHEHRGTIGKKFSQAYIQGVLKKNFALFVWKNIHEWSKLRAHFAYAWADAFVSLFFGDSPERREPAWLVPRLPPDPRRHERALAGENPRAGERHRGLPPASRRILPRSLLGPARGAVQASTYCSFRPTRSALPSTAAACSCIRPRTCSRN